MQNLFVRIFTLAANPLFHRTRARAQILAALLQRHRTGLGCWIDVAMTDWAFALMAMAQAKYLACGEAIGGGKDLLSGAVPCYDVYRTKDGHITVRLIAALKKLRCMFYHPYLDVFFIMPFMPLPVWTVSNHFVIYLALSIPCTFCSTCHAHFI